MCYRPEGFPEFMRKVVPELEANDGLRLWYRHLNCGFRLTATAGTDKMTTFVTVGANRVFAHVEGECTYQNWINALKAGRTFVTNSPVLSFTVNGQRAGRDTAVRLEARQGGVRCMPWRSRNSRTTGWRLFPMEWWSLKRLRAAACTGPRFTRNPQSAIAAGWRRALWKT